MKRAVLIAGVTAFALALTAGVASAKPGGEGRHGPKASFEELDANGDGQLTLAELQAHAAARVAEIDSNGDGVITADELAAHAQRDISDKAEKMLEKRDENGDGQVTLDEMQPSSDRQERMFDRMDEDGDGSISAEEFEAKSKKGGKRKGGRDGEDES